MEGHTVVENRRGADYLSGMVVTKNAEIPEMAVLIVNHGVKNQHTLQLFFRSSSIFMRSPLMKACYHK